MPAGRPSRITDLVEFRDPKTQESSQIPITEAIIRYVRYGVWPTTAAQAHRVHATTMANWRSTGHALKLERDDPVNPRELTEEEEVYVEFLDAVDAAEAEGLAFHELNVASVAAGGPGDGRLSLEFLARRKRAIYGREIQVKHSGRVEHATVTEFDREVGQLVQRMREAVEAGQVPLERPALEAPRIESAQEPAEESAE